MALTEAEISELQKYAAGLSKLNMPVSIKLRVRAPTYRP
jgi:hypothetical protein